MSSDTEQDTPIPAGDMAALTTAHRVLIMEPSGVSSDVEYPKGSKGMVVDVRTCASSGSTVYTLRMLNVRGPKSQVDVSGEAVEKVAEWATANIGYHPFVEGDYVLTRDLPEGLKSNITNGVIGRVYHKATYYNYGDNSYVGVVVVHCVGYSEMEATLFIEVPNLTRANEEATAPPRRKLKW